MRSARGLVLLLALSCAAGAALLVQKAGRIPSAPPASTAAAKAETVDILVAARAIMIGETIGKAELRWQPWPARAVPAGSFSRAANAPATALPFEPAPARFALLEGEPISAAKLARPEHGSVLAGLVAPGMRAVSVPIREESSAGGFIQANDRVDVVVTRRQSEGAREQPRSEVLLRGVKVLAIGKALQGKAAAAGRTATLELTPAQATRLTAAQSSGEIALALIGTADAGQTDFPTASLAADTSDIRIMKFGRSSDRAVMQ
jgi:pilus assembly protein CpaB